MNGSCVVHICADYPDVFQPRNTPVIRRLVEGMRENGRQVVVSISRVSTPRLEAVVINGDDWAVRYFAPPLGVMHHYFLQRLAKRLRTLLVAHGVRPNIFIGHKFTVESLVCMKLGSAFKVPYVAAFMGNTDRKIFRAKPLMRRVFMDVANQASALVFPTPWTQRYFEMALHLGAGDCRFGRHLIPYISGECVVPRMTSAPDHARFVSIFRLDAWRLKNVERVIAALAKLREGGEAGTLDIIGGGSPKAVKAIERVIARHRASHYVRLLGEKNRTEIDRLLPEYCAMVLPSFPESFGLVYLEALTAGVPVMTARNAGFDGYFESAFPGVIVAHDNVTEIMEGLQALSRDAGLLRKRIVQEEGSFGIFERDRIVRSYEKLISDVLE